MSWVELITLCLKFSFSLWSYFSGKADKKEQALKELAEQFAKLETQGYPVMRDILVQMGRSSWIPWDQIPVGDWKIQEPAKKDP
jgi:hypothetical protein